MSENRTIKVAVFVSFSGAGGVERMVANLLKGFVAKGILVDLLLVRARGAHLSAVPSAVRLVPLGASHTLTSLLPLVRYLRRERPVALLAVKERAGRVAVLARRLSGVSTRVVIRIGTTVSGALEGCSKVKRWWWYRGMRFFYPWADRVVAVSRGVAEDIAGITALPAGRIRVIHNPVVVPELEEFGREPVEHPWFRADASPVIIGVGRLTRQKDFPTLIRAFARLRSQRPCRLMILGEGGLRGGYEALARELEISADVAFPGFLSNPYAYMAKAHLFVLSSLWEGSPNVLTEALALGIPVVATDCPSGPREILQGGRFGRLVEMGDADALAEAMSATLAHPPSPEFLRSAVEDYTVEVSAARYLEVLGIKA